MRCRAKMIYLSLFFLVGFWHTGLVLAQDTAVPGADDRLGGRMQAQIDGEILVFPLLKTDIDADIQGDLATVTVVQTFVNPMDKAINASYLFPLNKDAAVYEMIMRVGDETVRAQIQRIEQARAKFKRAQQQGRSAALLTQHRPNMFTQKIANLMPDLPIKVTLRYVQTVPKVDGDYELVLPLVVGPRFQPGHAGKPPVDETEQGEQVQLYGVATSGHALGEVPRWHEAQSDAEDAATENADSEKGFGQWELEQLPLYPPVSGMEIPDQIDKARVSLQLSINGGMPIQRVHSRTHGLVITKPSSQQHHITLDEGRVIDNRDFVLRYRLAGDTSNAGLLSYRDKRGGFFSLLIEPPAVPMSRDITPREMVFVLDCSGSMSGLPMRASKGFMREALRGLRPTDSFRIIRFSDAATEFSEFPLPATQENIARGIRYTDALYGSGGTMMSSGIRQAFLPPVSAGSLRIVTFLTDGYIGNQSEILKLIDKQIGSARLFAFGVGTGVNRYLLSEMGRVGRGFTRYMDPTEDAQEVAKELAARLQSPVLTDIEIDWGKLSPEELMPHKIPDLFAGQSIRVQGRYNRPGEYTITLRGRVNGRKAVMPLNVSLPKRSRDGEAVALVWARSAIAESMRQLSAPHTLRERNLSDDQLKHQVTSLGLGFSLVTRWTAFIAVSDKIYNHDPRNTPTRPVPLPQVEGVSHLAYGGQGAAGFSGHAAPELSTVLSLFLVVVLMGLFAWLRREQFHRFLG